MPMYEYYCAECQKKFELLTSYSTADQVVCKYCQAENVKRLLSVFARGRGEGSGAPEVRSSSGPVSMGGGCCGGGCGCH